MGNSCMMCFKIKPTFGLYPPVTWQQHNIVCLILVKGITSHKRREPATPQIPVELVLRRVSVAALWVPLWFFHLQFSWNPLSLGLKWTFVRSDSFPVRCKRRGCWSGRHLFRVALSLSLCVFVAVSDAGRSPCNHSLGEEPGLDVMRWEWMKGRLIMAELMTFYHDSSLTLTLAEHQNPVKCVFGV